MTYLELYFYKTFTHVLQVNMIVKKHLSRIAHFMYPLDIILFLMFQGNVFCMHVCILTNLPAPRFEETFEISEIPIINVGTSKCICYLID